jgi:hypothetical protein
MQSFINGDENGVKWAFWRLTRLGGSMVFRACTWSFTPTSRKSQSAFRARFHAASLLARLDSLPLNWLPPRISYPFLFSQTRYKRYTDNSHTRRHESMGLAQVSRSLEVRGLSTLFSMSLVRYMVTSNVDFVS